jgi:hypothetical protein
MRTLKRRVFAVLFPPAAFLLVLASRAARLVAGREAAERIARAGLRRLARLSEKVGR